MNAAIEIDYFSGRYISNSSAPWSAYVTAGSATYHGWGNTRSKALEMAFRLCFQQQPHVFDRSLIEPEPTQMYADEDMFPPGA